MTEKPEFTFVEATAVLEVFADRLTLEPKGLGGFLTKGLQGKKEIAFASVTSVQVKEAGMTTGYIQFGVKGGVEGVGGAMEAVYDENSFMFGGFMDGENDAKNRKAAEIAEFLRERIGRQVAKDSGSPSLADELNKLNELRLSGVLSDTEFAEAKAKLLK